MNESDTAKIITFIKELTQRHPNSAVIAFESNELLRVLSNQRRSTRRDVIRVREDIDDFLATNVAHKALGDCFTVCEFEFDTWYLIAASKAASTSVRFASRFLSA